MSASRQARTAGNAPDGPLAWSSVRKEASQNVACFAWKKPQGRLGKLKRHLNGQSSQARRARACQDTNQARLHTPSHWKQAAPTVVDTSRAVTVT